MIKVKICGIKNLKDALNAVDAGADAIGLLIGQRHTSNDFIDIKEGREIVSSLPPFISSVLVTHIKSPEEVISMAKDLGCNHIQIHSEMTPEGCEKVKKELKYIKTIKAYHVVDESSLFYGDPYLDKVDAFLLDTANAATGQVGGTGMTHDWDISLKIMDKYKKIPFFIAGGLNPENVGKAVEKLNPYAVDANSGTKGSDGFKDEEKLKQFIKMAKRGN